MATFPAIEPRRRSYDMGAFPMEEQEAWPAGLVRYLTGYAPSAITDMVLSLEYQNLSEFDIQQIRTHYNFQQGAAIPFKLPAIIWQGHTTAIPIGTFWRYASAPAEQQRSGHQYDVTVNLISEDLDATDLTP
jgi:hypothetical protein